MKKEIIVTIGLILSVMNIYVFAGDQDPDITIQELYQHIRYLASDSLEGRKPGTEGSKSAANYIRSQLLENNLILLGERGFQYFPITTSVQVGPKNQLLIDNFSCHIKNDYIPVAFSATDTLKGSVVFVGYGFDFKEDTPGWDDYKNVDVSNKWVMILRASPQSNQKGDKYLQYSSLRKKVFVAKDNGAAGVLFVSGNSFDPQDELMHLQYQDAQFGVDIPVIHITRKIANKILDPKETVAQLEDRLKNTLAAHSFEIDKTILGITEIVKNRENTQNVVALLPGQSPDLKEEYIVLGAHYDHLGWGGPGSSSRRPDTLAIHNGADDNASGVAGILEIIEKLSALEKGRGRSIIFVAFGAEEVGTVGSKFFVDNAPVSIEKIKFMFNLDMVGRLEPARELTIGGTGTAKGLEEMIMGSIAPYDLKPAFSDEGYGPSDHSPFYASDIPVLFFLADVHADYHTPDDDIDKINFEGEKAITDFICDLILEIANLPNALAFQQAGPKSRPSMRGRMKVTLGIMPDITSSKINGVKADLVIPEGPAEKAGMQKGDIVIEIGGKPVNDIYEYMHRLSSFEKGDQITVKVLRNDKTLVLDVGL